MESITVMELSLILMGKSMQGNGKMGDQMVKEHELIPMGTSMLVNGRTVEKTVKEYTLMKKGNGKKTNMKENGKREKRMGMEHTLIPMEEKQWVSLEEESIGTQKNMTRKETSFERG